MLSHHGFKNESFCMKTFIELKCPLKIKIIWHREELTKLHSAVKQRRNLTLQGVAICTKNRHMQEVIDTIVEKVSIRKKELFRTLLNKCLHESTDPDKVAHQEFPNVVFKQETFFKGFTALLNEQSKDKNYELGTEAITIICQELGFDMEKEECFILYHLRDLGKFRKKDADLLKELKVLWKTNIEFILEDGEFAYALKSLMRKKFINYRKGNLYLNPNIIIRYR